MALSGTISISVPIKCPPESFYYLWKAQIFQLPKIAENVEIIVVDEEDWDVDGSAQTWKYAMEGKKLKAKKKVSFDDINKSIMFDVTDGDLLNEFKVYKAVMKMNPKEVGKSILTWTVDYEKRNRDVGIPVSYLVLYEKLTEEVDAHILKN